ncbi:MAG: helix-turn-helix domain-containing protein [Rikenellaceae bacterium]|jgi:excisionase family DNA binding protein
MELKELNEQLDRIEAAALSTKAVLNFTEAAIYSGLSKSHLYKLTSGRGIPHYKPHGKMVYFNRVELEQWLQQNRVNTTDEITGLALNYCSKKG